METSSDYYSVLPPRSVAVRWENNAFLYLPETPSQASSFCEEHVLANVCSGLLLAKSKHLFSVILLCLLGNLHSWSLPKQSKLRRQQAANFSSFTSYFSSALTTCFWCFFSIKRFVPIPTVFSYSLKSWPLLNFNYGCVSILYLYSSTMLSP